MKKIRKLLGASKVNNRWLSQIRLNDKLFYLGYFDTKEEAHQAYRRAYLIIHKKEPKKYSYKQINYENKQVDYMNK